MARPDSPESNDRLAPDFLDFIVCLNEHAVEAVLVGGYAVGVHGVIRATGDIDFLYRRTTGNVERLCAALADFGAPPNVIDFETLMTPEMVTMFGQPPYRIDLLSDITGVTFDEVSEGCTIATIEGQAVQVIGLAELRRNKAATGRKKDAKDLRLLARTEEPPSSSQPGRAAKTKRPASAEPPGPGRRRRS